MLNSLIASYHISAEQLVYERRPIAFVIILTSLKDSVLRLIININLFARSMRLILLRSNLERPKLSH
ncbi:MAG: hypothetical protein ACTS5P_01675 [Candidatus Hodgkinia cicadicola]